MSGILPPLYMAEKLPIRRETLSDQSINQYVKTCPTIHEFKFFKNVMLSTISTYRSDISMWLSGMQQQANRNTCIIWKGLRVYGHNKRRKTHAIERKHLKTVGKAPPTPCNYKDSPGELKLFNLI